MPESFWLTWLFWRPFEEVIALVSSLMSDLSVVVVVVVGQEWKEKSGSTLV